MATPIAKDLFVLTADAQLQKTIETLLNHRRPSLGIGDISYDVHRHPRKDPGCRVEADSFLRQLRGSYNKALVASDVSAIELEKQLEDKIEGAGWELDSVSVIVIEPELEAWLFGRAFRHLEQAVLWPGSEPIRNWLTANNHLSSGTVKPADPKAAIDAILFQKRIPRSASLYEEMAKRVSLAGCQDRAFQKLLATLRRWFPAR